MAMDPNAAEESMYCDACHNLDPHGPLTDRDAWMRDQFGPGRIALQDRTPEDLNDAECDFCGLLRRVCDRMSPGWAQLDMWLEDGQTLKMSVWGQESCALELSAVEDGTWHFPRLQEIPSSVESEPSQAFITRALKECVEDHAACRGPQFVPKRLVAIDEPKVIESTNYVPYLALSYCWGDVLPLKSTRATLAGHKRSIDPSLLPRVFREAFALASRLKFNYIWIDSLCIIQDDIEDWIDQYPQMASIYEGAGLVVAASSATGCNESFIDIPRPRELSFDFTWNQNPAPIRVRRVPTVGLHEDYETFYSRRDPLDARGWPLQERLLATRLLVFSTGELQWTCKTKTMCEGGHRDTYRVARSLYSLRPDEAYGFWHEQVMEYSKRRLRFPDDKLPALAGVASKIHELTGSDYIAGMWRQNLLKDMLWERHIFQGLKWDATKTWRAPSFSWASVEGNVFYGEIGSAHHGNYVSEVLEAGCKPGNAEAPFGEVVDGYVIVRGSLLEAEINTPPDWDDDGSSTLFWVEHGGWRIRLRSDTHLRQGRSPGSADDKPEYAAFRTPEGSETPIRNAKAWILIAANWMEYADSEEGKRWVTCLVLSRSATDPHAFERLGHNNQPWPLTECDLSKEEYAALDPYVFGTAEKTTIKII